MKRSCIIKLTLLSKSVHLLNCKTYHSKKRKSILIEIHVKFARLGLCDSKRVSVFCHNTATRMFSPFKKALPKLVKV